VALVRTIDAINKAKKKAEGDEQFGFDIVASAVEGPLFQIAYNAGFDGDLVVENVKEMDTNEGFNAGTYEYEDLVKAGIIDPVLVAKTALINAASVSGLMLTTNVMIADLKDDDEPTVGSVS
jgi:chaperonin GroEL